MCKPISLCTFHPGIDRSCPMAAVSISLIAAGFIISIEYLRIPLDTSLFSLMLVQGDGPPAVVGVGVDVDDVQ